MKRLSFGCLVMMLAFVCSQPAALVDGSNSEVSAEQRLRDYLRESKYPPENVSLSGDEPPLDKVPLVAGDATDTAEILAFAGERLSAGSLFVAFRVRVAKPGLFSFRTFLLSETGSPLFQAMVTRDLKAGEHTLEFLFYGKAVRDRGQSGRFILPGITGEKLPDAAERSGRLRFFAKPFSTAAYQLKDFTDRNWDSEEKRAKIRELQKEIKTSKKKTR